jgi:hypothetical protein
MRIMASIPDMSLPPVGSWQRLKRLVPLAGNVPVIPAQAGPLIEQAGPNPVVAVDDRNSPEACDGFHTGEM